MRTPSVAALGIGLGQGGGEGDDAGDVVRAAAALAFLAAAVHQRRDRDAVRGS